MAKAKRNEARLLVQIALTAWVNGHQKITCARIPETAPEKIAFAFFLGSIANSADVPQSVFGFRDELAHLIDDVIAEGPISLDKVAEHARSSAKQKH